ncbi:MAG: lipid-A-disaccharide synthase, partial [Bryobacteraceae bacterium]
GDLYASRLVTALRKRWPETEFFGCAGARMREAGVRPVIEAESLAVVGLIEVISHIPRIYKQFRKLVRAAESERPSLAILTDSPDFHLRLARRLKRLGIPVVYLVAPQAWAWRKGRVRTMRRTIGRLLCIFPFEEEFFRRHGIHAEYIGHPLARSIRPTLSKEEFFAKHRIRLDRPLISLLPGSRASEALRHLQPLADAAIRIHAEAPSNFILATPAGGLHGLSAAGTTIFRERIARAPIQVVEGETWDVLAHSDLALAASGTVATEAALLGTPTVTFYKVTGISWFLGKFLVRVPFYSMVNLVAGRAVIPELMQNEVSGESIAGTALQLLNNPASREEMRRGLAEIAATLASALDPMERSADVIERFLAFPLEASAERCVTPRGAG